MIRRDKEFFLSICDRINEYGLIFLVIFTPLAFGAVHVWAYTLMELTVFFLLSVFLLKQVITSLSLRDTNRHIKKYSSLQLVKTPLNLPLLFFLGLILFQMMPLHPSMIRHLSPNTYDLYQQTLPSRPDGHDTGYRTQDTGCEMKDVNVNLTNSDSWRSLSIYPHATKIEFSKIFAYVVVFFLITNTITTSTQAKRLVLAIIITGAFVSFLGLMQMLSGTNKIYWFWLSKYKVGDYFGPFVNPNHYAGYLEMVIPLALGFLITYFLKPAMISINNWRHHLFRIESHLSKSILLIFVIVIMASSLFLSLSRGGTVAFLLSLVFFCIILGFKKAQRKKRKVVLIIFGLVLTFLIWVGIGQVLKELSTLLNIHEASPQRPGVWRDTLNLVMDFPLFGVGLGNFQCLYPKYKTMTSQAFWEHAHNDYVEMLSDTGSLGALLFFGGIIFLMVKVIIKWHERKDPFVVGITLGGVTGVVSILLHSVVEFNLHIPANALLFFIVLGLTVSTVHLKIRKEKECSLLPARTFTLSLRMNLIIFSLTMVIMGVFSATVVRTYLGHRYFQLSKSHNSAVNSRHSMTLIDPTKAINLGKAITFDKSNATYHYELGRYYAGMMSASWKEGKWKLEKGKWVFDPGDKTFEYGCKAFNAYSQAVNFLPTNGWFHFNLGWILDLLSQLSEDSIKYNESIAYLPYYSLTDADNEFKLAVLLDPANIYIREYVMTGRSNLTTQQ